MGYFFFLIYCLIQVYFNRVMPKLISQNTRTIAEFLKILSCFRYLHCGQWTLDKYDLLLRGRGGGGGGKRRDLTETLKTLLWQLAISMTSCDVPVSIRAACSFFHEHALSLSLSHTLSLSSPLDSWGQRKTLNGHWCHAASAKRWFY